MPDCPRCHQPVSSQAIACPHCQTPLKAYGHPGIPLHRATGDISLCETCLYDADDTCTFPQRPHARDCTLYTDRTAPKQDSPTYHPHGLNRLKAWVSQNLAGMILAGLAIASVWIALSE